MLSRRTIGSERRQRPSSAGWHKKPSATRYRRIAFEPLEDRRLLSVGALQPAAASLAALAESVSLAGATAGASLSAISGPVSGAASASSDASAGPTIGQVVISQATGRMSWNVSGATPLATSTLQIDGTTVSDVAGPFNASSGGVNFSASIDSLATGLHSYTIAATDTAGDTSSATDTFTISDTVAATSTPTIRNVVVLTDDGQD